MSREPIKFFNKRQKWINDQKLNLPKKITSGHTLNEDNEITYLAFFVWGAIIIWLIMI